MDTITLVLSSLSILVAVVGTGLSNRRASEALAVARTTAENAVWAPLQAAVQRLIGDPSEGDHRDRLENLRIAMAALVDELPSYSGLDAWLDAERRLGAGLAHQVLDRVKGDDTVDQRLAVVEPYVRWAETLGSNLRLFRREGFDSAKTADLCAHTEDLVQQVYTDNDRPMPLSAGSDRQHRDPWLMA